jgi:diguanylate cyclase (GGDEF)-like protein
MKHSIKKIFDNLSLMWIIITFVAAISTLIMLEQNISYNKINNLKNQKNVLSALISLNKNDIELAILKYDGDNAKLLNNTNNLRNSYNYDYMGQYILGNKDEYLSDLNKLTTLTTLFNEKANKYYTKEKQDEKRKLQELNGAFDDLNKHIDSMIFKNISYEEVKFNILRKISILEFILILLTTLWYRTRLNTIYKDFLSLFAINSRKDEYKIFSKEVDAISIKMNKKADLSENTLLMDSQTELYNLKGMYSAYSDKSSLKDENIKTLSMLQIDNFSKLDEIFSQETIHSIIKKIAFKISLHQQSADVIARTDFNQFTIIFSRKSREESFKEIDNIRKSISEITFKTKNGNETNITLSGVFSTKADGVSLEESMQNLKKVLQNCEENKISQSSKLARK